MTSAPAASASSFADERRQRAVQADVECGRRLPRERVGAERDDLELGMPEHAVEGLLSGITGGAEDRNRGHVGIILNLLRNMQIKPRMSR